MGILVMKKFAFAAAALGAMLVAGAAQASVTYNFAAYTSLEGGVSGFFVYTAPTFITSFLTVPASSLSACYITSTEIINVGCDYQGFSNSINIVPFDPTFYSVVNFGYIDRLSGNPGGIDYYFASNALSAEGSYDSLYFGPGQFAHLDVIDNGTVPVFPPAVPEPASWAMMIAGFGIVGGAMRKTNRRRRSNVRVTYA